MLFRVHSNSLSLFFANSKILPTTRLAITLSALLLTLLLTTGVAKSGDFTRAWTIQNGEISNARSLQISDEEGVVESGGRIESSSPGVLVLDGGRVANHGTISSSVTAIALMGTSQDFYLINSGELISDGQGLWTLVDGTGSVHIDNSGRIEAGETGLDLSEQELIGTNRGSIIGLTEAGIIARRISAFVNEDTIFGANFGILADEISEFANHGTIFGRRDTGLHMGSGTVVNFGNIVGGQRGVAMDKGTLINIRGHIEGTKGIEVNRANPGSAVDAGDATIVNAGIVRSIDGPDGIAIDFQELREDNSDPNSPLTYAGDDTLELQKGNLIIGRINLGLGDDRLATDTGLNLNYTFDSAPELVDIASNIYDQRANADGTVSIAVLDKTALSQADEALAEITSGISNVLQQRFATAGRATGQLSGSQPTGLSFLRGPGSLKDTPEDLEALPGNEDFLLREKAGAALWAQGIAAGRSSDASASTLPTHMQVSGLFAGLDAAVNSDVTLGAFLGTGAVDLKIKASEGYTRDAANLIVVNSVIRAPATHEYVASDAMLTGLYGRYSQGNAAIDVSLTLGWTDTIHERVILDNTMARGYENVSGSYNGWFIAPEIGWTQKLDGLGLEVSLRGRYAAQFLDAYSESGENGIDVGKRDVHMLQSRAELARPFDLAAGSAGVFTVTPYGGMDIRHLLEGDKVTLDLLGNGMSTFALGQDKTELTGFAGLRLSAQVTDSLALEANIEGRISDADSETVSGSVGGVWKF